jgi:hypothetical protein
VLFGSDAATDGAEHFVRKPPNIEMTENYNGALLRLARRLAPEVTRKLLEDNTRKLFGLPRPAYGSPGAARPDVGNQAEGSRPAGATGTIRP